MNDITNIRQIGALKDLVCILAAWSSKFMDIAAIGSALAIDRRTLTNYIGALQSFYIVERIPPWRKTDYDRIGRQDKIFMADTGMMSALLGWRILSLASDSDKLGKAFETFVYNELIAQIDSAEDTYHLYHYRDREKREIDFLIEHQDGKILAVEVKSGLTIKKSDFKHIEWFRQNLVKDKTVIGLILYTGNDIIPFGANLWAIPYSCLWA